MKCKIWTFTLSALLTLSGCGSSGEDWASKDPSALATSTNSFDIAAAWTQLNLTPNTKQMSTSGTCSGTFIISNTAATYVSSTDLYNFTTINGLYQRCSPEFANWQGLQYYNSVHYFKYQNFKLSNFLYNYQGAPNIWRAPANFPFSAKVGDSGLIGVLDNYTNANQTTKAGVEEWRYVIEQNTATTVVFNLIVNAYDTTTSSTATDYLSAPIIQTEQYRYVVTANNTMTLRSYDVERPDGFKITAK
jgi:hypothetical protein